MDVLWEFAREIGTASSGITTSYYDAVCQSIYLNNGQIRTQVAELPEGHWESIEPGPEIIISDTGFNNLDFEHHYNGILAGSAQHDENVVFLLYEYMLDITNWLQNGSFQLQSDNPIKAGQISIKNADANRFEDSAFTLFAPGNKIIQRFRIGNSQFYDMGLFYIESSPYGELDESFSFSGRNLLGFLLATQTLDEHTEYSGKITDIFTAMLNYAGIPDNLILVQATDSTATFSFSASDTYMDAISKATALIDWYFDDLPNGKIVIGTASFMRTNVASTGIYSFDRGSDVFTRDVERHIDGAYSRVCVRRGGPNPLRIYNDVPYFDGWFIGLHRTYYQDVAETVSQSTMEVVCQQLAEGLQYSGIIETFFSPFRPWLQIGDIARVTGGDAPRLAGIITDIKHQYGESGFFTTFTVTSGGTISNPDNPETVASKYVGKLGGANRQRRLMDYIQSGATTTIKPEPVGAIVYQTAVAGGYTGDEQTLNQNLSRIASGAVLPAGGDPGQKLIKASETDYDTIWSNEDIWGVM